MIKTDLLRQMMANAMPRFKTDPESLEIYVSEGVLVSSAALRSASFEYRYVMEVLLMDHPADDVDAAMLAVELWAQNYQPDLLINAERWHDGVKFQAQILSDSTVDLLLKIRTTEIVIVEAVNGKPQFKHVADKAPEMSGHPSKLRELANMIGMNGE
ncbi:phage tail protein [Hafnia alvei]|uniref:phage tail protein n=1 Tax=Hafnia alvei TaxID=569 RepID=UPI001642DB55|nr:phage tail protein [Hafnia alvei]MBI0277274.1 phage tail protein [Hafnia alvei]